MTEQMRTNANEMGSLCVYLWGDYLEKRKNKQIKRDLFKTIGLVCQTPGYGRSPIAGYGRRMQLKPGHLPLGDFNHVITS